MGSVAMAFTRLLGVCSNLYTAEDPSHDGVDGVPLLRFGAESVVRQAHRGDVLRARKLARGIGQVAHVRRHEVPDPRLARKRKTGGPVVLHHLESELWKQAAAPAQVNARREALPTRGLPDPERQPLQHPPGVRAEQLRALPALLARPPPF